MQPREKTVVEKALDTFRKRTRIGADFLYEKTGTDLYGDGIVRLAHEGQKWELKAEVKLRVNRATIALLKQKMDRAGEGLLVTDYVNPELAEVMRDQGIFLSMPQETLSSTPPQSISLSKAKNRPRS